MQVLEVIKAVEAVEKARQRIPEELYGKSFFGHYDLWMYIDTKDDENECDTCKGFRWTTIAGSELRSTFPDLTIWDENMILPNVHMTLWGADTCKCVLIRLDTEGEDYKPERIVFYTVYKLKPFKPKPETEEE